MIHDRKKVICQDPRDPHFVADPYFLYEQLHALTTPVFWQNYGFWCVCKYETVNSVLRDGRFARLPPAGFENQPSPQYMQDFARAEKHSLLALEPPQHTRLRKAVNHAFVSRQIKRMSSSIQTIAHRCIDQFEAQGSAELLSRYATPIPVEVITRLLGVPVSYGQQLLEWSHAMVRVYTLLQSEAEEHAANEAAANFMGFVQQLIEQKRCDPDDALISHLLANSGGGQALNDDEIISITILLLNAGHEATVHQLGNAIKTLLTAYPSQTRDELIALLNNDETADAVVAECMRFDAPLHLFTRYAQTDIELSAGVRLAKGEEVGLLLAAANRCPLKFHEPNRYDPRRTDAAHLSLGAGIHFCVGAQLAKLELRIALQTLFERLPTLQLMDIPRYQDTYHFHGLQSLQVSW